jgi:spermidine synthase
MTAQKNRVKQFPSEKKEYDSPSSGIIFKIKNLIYRARSPFQKIEVIENEHLGRVLLLDGLVQTA